jgi:hypothetical protein
MNQKFIKTYEFLETVIFATLILFSMFKILIFRNPALIISPQIFQLSFWHSEIAVFYIKLSIFRNVNKPGGQAKASHEDHFQYNVSEYDHMHHQSLVTSLAVYLLHVALHQDHIPAKEFYMCENI